MGAPTNAAYVKKVLANSEPSTQGGKADTTHIADRPSRHDASSEPLCGLRARAVSAVASFVAHSANPSPQIALNMGKSANLATLSGFFTKTPSALPPKATEPPRHTM